MTLHHTNSCHGRVYWITGLSGSGKSTLAKILYEYFVQQGIHPILLDGDVIRQLLLDIDGFDVVTRRRIAEFNGRLCHFLSMQNMVVICSTISLFHHVHAWNRHHIPGYYEIFLDVPMDLLTHRDPHGIYHRVSIGDMMHVVGVDIPAEFPLNPDLRIVVNAESTPEDSLLKILDHFGTKSILA